MSALSTIGSRHDHPSGEDVVGRALELHEEGLAAVTGDRYAVALRSLRRGLVLLDTAPEGPAGDKTPRLAARARLMVTLAFCTAETGSQAEALGMLETVREGLGELADPVLRDELRDRVDQNRALMLFGAGRVAEGLEVLNPLVARAERDLADGGADLHDRADRLVIHLTNRGNAHSTLAEFTSATRDLERALELAARHGLHLRIGIAAHALGNVLERTGDVPAALRRYEQAFRIFHELEPGLLARLRLDQAEALLAVGLADEAGRLLDEVLPELRRQGNVQDHAEAELFRSSAALMDGDLPRARRMASSASRRLSRQGSSYPAALAALLVARVDVARALGARRVPPTLPARVEELADSLWSQGMPGEAAQARLLAVRLELKRGEVQRAAQLMDLVPKPHRFASIDHRMLLRLCRAELAAARGSRRDALAEAKAGFAELDRVRDRLGDLEMVSGTAVHGLELGEFAIRLILRGGDSAADARRLFAWSERTRAQTHRYEPVPSSVEPDLRQRITEVRRLGRTLLRARLEGVPTAELESRYAAGRREVVRLARNTNQVRTSRPLASHNEVAEHLGNRVLVSFVESGDDLAAVVIAAGRTRLVRLGSASSPMEYARQLHADLDALAPDHLPEQLAAVLAASARHRAALIDQALLRPLAELLGDRELVVVPTGALHAVPWGSLPTCQSRSVVVAPSATAWLAADRRVPGGTGVLLVRGPGVPATLDELDLVARHPDTKLLDALDARVGAVLEAMDGAALVHIAAHGAHEPENALFSRLELVDGALFAHEVGQLARPPDQVVLAADELALSRLRPGDEPLGFAGALLTGGTRTVVAALCRVGDQPTAAAMADYHRNLSAGATPAAALAAAVAVDPLRRPFVCLGAG